MPHYPIRGPSQTVGLGKYHAYRVSNSGKQSSFIAAPSAVKYDCIQRIGTQGDGTFDGTL